MDLRYCFDYNFVILLVFGAVVVFMSCSSSKNMKEQASVPVEDLPQIVREASRPQSDSTKQSSKNDVKLRYKNKSTSVTIPIDPDKQDFVLELNGVEQSQSAKKGKGKQRPRSARADSAILQDSLVQATMAKKIKRVLKNFRRAQDLFYRENYDEALRMVSKSLEIQRTADALGLKGSIFFVQDDMSSAKYYWNQAVQMDPEIPVPNIPELDSLIREIKATEDQEEAQ